MLRIYIYMYQAHWKALHGYGLIPRLVLNYTVFFFHTLLTTHLMTLDAKILRPITEMSPFQFMFETYCRFPSIFPYSLLSDE